MPERHRVQDVRQGHIGSYYHVSMSPQTGFRSVAEGSIRTCDDVVNERYHANDFVLDDRESYWPRLNGEWRNDAGVLVVGCYDMPCSHMAAEAPSPLSERYGLLDHLELSDLAWKVLAQTNVSQPSFSMPTQLGELWELPSIIKGFGGSLLQKVAAGNLAWRWAAKPMISDFQKMLKFQQLVMDRARELRQLAKGKKLRKKCSLGKDEEDGEFGWIDYPFESVVCPVWGVSKTSYRMRMWGTVSYTLDPNWSFPTMYDDNSKLLGRKRPGIHHRMQQYAKHLVAGMTSYETLAAAWELLPWSWLVDWFFGIGEVIAACNNTVPVTWGSICVMRTSVATTEHKITRIPEWCTATVPRPSVRIVKERYVATPVLPFSVSFPLFDGGKWSVLGSLAALAFGPKSR